MTSGGGRRRRSAWPVVCCCRWPPVAAARAERSRPPETATDAPVAGGTAVVALSADPDVLNPLLCDPRAIAGLVYAEMHSGLTEMADDLTYRPRIASVVGHGAGQPVHHVPAPALGLVGRRAVDGPDVVYSFDLFKDPTIASPRRRIVPRCRRAAALDRQHRPLHLRAPPAGAAAARPGTTSCRCHVVADLDRATVGSWPINQRPLSSGAVPAGGMVAEPLADAGAQRSVPGRAGPCWTSVVFRILPGHRRARGARDRARSIWSTTCRRTRRVRLAAARRCASRPPAADVLLSRSGTSAIPSSPTGDPRWRCRWRSTASGSSRPWSPATADRPRARYRPVCGIHDGPGVGAP